MFELPAQITDASSVLARIRSRTPDVLITTTVDENSLVIARQMVATGTNVPLLYQFLGPQLAMYRKSLGANANGVCAQRSEEHTSELQSLMRISYAVI